MDMERDELKKLKNRIDRFCESGINAFSPTISPAPKSVARNEIESIHEGIKYFVNRGITEVVIQKKYMGSYCDIYLHKNLEETYFVSRNGYRIKQIDLDEAKNACVALHDKLDWTNINMYIIQSELMPWGTLGKGLIDNEFEGYLNAHQNHLSYLKGSNLYEKIESVKESEAYREFITFYGSHSEKEVKAKYPSHIIRQYKSLENFRILDLDTYEEGVNVYANQIAHFGKDGSLYFKPFNILKKVFEDGSEEIVNDNLSYASVNDDEFIHLNIDTNQELQPQIQHVYDWFDTLTSTLEEGIIIKPRQAFMQGIAPAFKVRNNHYLTMIYGVFFMDELSENIRKRNIGRKLECSVNDWMINWLLLKIKYKNIHRENYALKNLVLDRILGEKIEMGLDTRL